MPESAKGESSLTAHAQETLATELPAIEAALKRILASLDTRITPCCTCGLNVAKAYNDVKAADMFRSTLRKIQAYRVRAAV